MGGGVDILWEMSFYYTYSVLSNYTFICKAQVNTYYYQTIIHTSKDKGTTVWQVTVLIVIKYKAENKIHTLFCTRKQVCRSHPIL